MFNRSSVSVEREYLTASGENSAGITVAIEREEDHRGDEWFFVTLNVEGAELTFAGFQAGVVSSLLAEAVKVLWDKYPGRVQGPGPLPPTLISGTPPHQYPDAGPTHYQSPAPPPPPPVYQPAPQAAPQYTPPQQGYQQGQRTGSGGNDPATGKQQGFIATLFKAAHLTDAGATALIQQRYAGKISTGQLTKGEASDLIEYLKANEERIKQGGSYNEPPL